MGMEDAVGMRTPEMAGVGSWGKEELEGWGREDPVAAADAGSSVVQ
jgi:hypothetical protein